MRRLGHDLPDRCGIGGIGRDDAPAWSASRRAEVEQPPMRIDEVVSGIKTAEQWTCRAAGLPIDQMDLGVVAGAALRGDDGETIVGRDVHDRNDFPGLRRLEYDRVG